jgi:hypothetical protein
MTERYHRHDTMPPPLNYDAVKAQSSRPKPPPPPPVGNLPAHRAYIRGYGRCRADVVVELRKRAGVMRRGSAAERLAGDVLTAFAEELEREQA